jgi:2-polyprenyl-3-methyl-5-hydroxy-6-metoxy-1,4-benzoquinol methylase
MSSDLTEFYTREKANDPAYAAGSYDVRALLARRPFQEWVKKHRGGTRVRVLDVGCGRGVFIKDMVTLLGERGVSVSQVVGVDLMEEHPAAVTALKVPLEYHRQSIDGCPLPFDTDRFDFISCNHVLEHVFRTEYVAREFWRVLAPDGLCLISVPNLAFWGNRVALLFAGQPIGTEVGTETTTYGFWPKCGQKHLAQFRTAGHIRDFTPRALADLTTRCGFRVVGWWNHDERWWLRWTAWSGRNVGVLLQKRIHASSMCPESGSCTKVDCNG